MNNTTMKILFIHDSPGDIRLIGLLHDRSDRLDIVHSSRSGVNFDQLRGGKFDACLLDLDHIEGPGDAILATIRKQAGNVPVVVLIDNKRTEQELAALQLDVWDGLVLDREDADTIVRAVFSAMKHRKTEQALRESEVRYRQLLESVSDYVYIVRTVNGRPAASWHSPSCVAVTGYASDEYAADPILWYRMIHEDDRRSVVNMTNRVFAGEAPPPLEHRIIHKNGGIRWIKNTPIPRCDQQGRLVACEGLVSDITERKRAEEELLRVNSALRESEELLKRELENRTRAKKEWETTFDAISNPVFIHDQDYRLMRANKAYCSAAGMTFQELIGKPYYDIFPKLDVPFASSVQAMTMHDEQPGHPDEELSVSSLNKTFRARSYPIRDDNGAHFCSVLVLEDITEMKRAEEQMRQEMEVTANLLMIAEAAVYTMDIDRLMGHIARCASKVLGSDACVTYLWDRDRGIFQPAQHHGLDHQLVPLFRTELLDEKLDFIRRVQETKQPFMVRFAGPGGSEPSPAIAVPFMRNDDAGARSPATSTALWMNDGVRTLVVIPLIGKTDTLGLIVPVYRSDRTFSERDRKIVDGLSRQVSLALDEAHLYRTSMERSLELNHKIEMLQVIHEIDRSILSSMEPSDILETAARNIPRIVPCERAEILLLDREKQGFIQATGNNGHTTSPGKSLLFSDTSATEVIKTARPQYLGYIEEQKDLLARELLLRTQGFLSHIRVPLMVKGEPIGVLGVDSKRTAAFTPENLSTLEKLAAQIGVALENTRLVADMKELLLGTVKSLSNAIDAKSPWTAGHSERVTHYALLIGKKMSIEEGDLKDLELGGLLHDVGKIGIHDIILNKPGALTKEEFEAVKKHPLWGVGLLEPIKQLNRVIPCIRHHHERFDGSGYPDGLKGESIPLWARILAVADVFDAMTADRPYRKAFKEEEACKELTQCSVTQFDPAIVKVFIDILSNIAASRQRQSPPLVNAVIN